MSESTELREAVDRLNASIEGLRNELVRKDVYAADKLLIAQQIASIDKDVRDVEKKVDADIADRKADRRLIIGAILATAGSFILQIYQQAQGVS